MKIKLALSLLALSAIPCQANVFKDVGHEVKETAIDFVTWKHPAWNLMVLAQLGADLADAKTTTDAEKRAPLSVETNHWLYGRHPDFKTVALTDIGESMLIGTASHWLHTHTPRPYIKTADYWWLIPQTLDIVANGHAAYHNAGLRTPAAICTDPDRDCERKPDPGR
jgi:hypothetical protein